MHHKNCGLYGTIDALLKPKKRAFFFLAVKKLPLDNICLATQFVVIWFSGHKGFSLAKLEQRVLTFLSEKMKTKAKDPFTGVLSVTLTFCGLSLISRPC